MEYRSTEVAHAIEDVKDIWNNTVFKRMVDEISLSHSVDDIIYDTDTFEKPIYRIDDDRFVSLYQGRLYETWGATTESGLVNGEALWDYFSEGYACYFKNPQLLKEKDIDLYEYIESVINDEI